MAARLDDYELSARRARSEVRSLRELELTRDLGHGLLRTRQPDCAVQRATRLTRRRSKWGMHAGWTIRTRSRRTTAGAGDQNRTGLLSLGKVVAADVGQQHVRVVCDARPWADSDGWRRPRDACGMRTTAGSCVHVARSRGIHSASGCGAFQALFPTGCCAR
jgi:hypothetical protein